jgi:RNA polymerase sigma-70 factor (ECF subfamily)
LTTERVRSLVDDLFRREAGRMVATLTRLFSPARIDLAEDVVQEALVRALKVWSMEGVPENPRAWIVQVARNRALDLVRRDRSFADKEAEIRLWAEGQGDDSARETSDPDEPRDDELRMIFVCCHDAIPRDARVALTLKTLGGFSVAEIARAFLSSEAAIEQRLVRAKRLIRERSLRFELPAERDLPSRLDSVVDVVYLLFNEGYGAHRGESLVRADLVREAIRLTTLLLETESTRLPRVHALLALFLLQGARLGARTAADGRLLLLAEQDRSAWDQGMISRGLDHLRRAASGDQMGIHHLEAGIAACHAAAPRAEATDWPRILALYDLLAAMNPSPVVLLNRAVAVAMVRGPKAALRELDALAGSEALARYYLLPATRGDLLRRTGERTLAAAAYREALALAGTEPERRFLEARIAECSGG